MPEYRSPALSVRDELKSVLEENLVTYKDTDLELYLKFNKEQTDSSGNDVTASITDSSAVFSSGKHRESVQYSVGSLSFNYINTTKSFWTFDMWYKPAAQNQETIRLYFKSSTDPYTISVVETASGGSLSFRFRGETEAITRSVPITIGEFNHIALSSDLFTGSIYVNGERKASASFGAGADFSGSNLNLLFPKMDILKGASFGQPTYDSLKIWDKTLGTKEIEWLYSGFTVYDHIPEHEGLRLPCAIIEMQPPPTPEYMFGDDRIDHIYITVDIIFKEREHVRVFDGVTLSDEKLAVYYSDLVRDILNTHRFTSSAVNPGRAEVRVRQHKERFQEKGTSFWLYGCAADLIMPYKGGLQ